MSLYQWKLQSRQDRRKLEYERIQKENYKFSEKLINAKAFLNRHEQKLFFDKHCELKQRLQRIPTNNSITMLNKSKQSSFLIYNDQLKEKQSHSLQQ
ncbi:hypothetical protein I4U23_006612 [Adineta vaga]|nr:hypothetical protein I4U23_006612 [Adineta vaga]